MIFLMLTGLVILAIGKVKLSRRFVLVGKPARIYGAILFLIAYPVSLGLSILASTYPAILNQESTFSPLLQIGAVLAVLFGTMLFFEPEPASSAPAPRAKPMSVGIWLVGLAVVSASGIAFALNQMRANDHLMTAVTLTALVVSGFFGFAALIVFYFWIRALIARKAS